MFSVFGISISYRISHYGSIIFLVLHLILQRTIKILSREELNKLLNKYPIYKSEVEEKNKDRYSIERIKAKLEIYG